MSASACAASKRSRTAEAPTPDDAAASPSSLSTSPPFTAHRRREDGGDTGSDTPRHASPPKPHTVQEKPFRDPIYRIMHRLPRSDVLEIVKCKFGKEHCERAVAYFDSSFLQNPLRRLKLQVGCSGPGGLHLFFPRLFVHRFALRTLDLSRNKLSADDVITLCDGLGLGGAREQASALGAAPATSSVSAAHDHSVLELLDLSYNLGIGNAGSIYLLNALRNNTTIRAVQLVSTSIDDDGALQLAPILRARPRPPSHSDGTDALVCYRQGYAAATEQRPYTFLLNLNHNVIGAAGTSALGKGLPSYVSVTLSKQRLKGSDNPLKKKRGGRKGGARASKGRPASSPQKPN